MIKTFEANPNTSCGLRPRVRRDLDHAERQEENAVFTSLLAFSMLQLAVCSLDGAVWSVHLALWALELIIKTLQAAVRGSQEAAWMLQSCLEATIGCLDDQKASKVAAETLRERLGERSEPQDAAGEA